MESRWESGTRLQLHEWFSGWPACAASCAGLGEFRQERKSEAMKTCSERGVTNLKGLRDALAALLLSFAGLFSGYAGTTVGELRCEYLENPIGIDVEHPRLSWVMNSTERGQTQTAYQVLVASSAARLKANQGDVWDSGKVQSDQSIQVPYAGRRLVSHH